jgi:hypothetical protein
MRGLEGAAEVVTGGFPTCWELDVMYNGNRTAEDGIEDENGDVYVRYVYACRAARASSLTFYRRVLASCFRFPRWP